MIFQILFFLALLAIFAACFVAFRSVIRGSLRPFARNLLIGLLIFELILAIADVLNYRYAGAIPPFWEWFFDLQDELNLGATFSAIQLMIVSMVALVIGWLTPDLKRWQRAYWLLLTLIFAYLSFDEFYSFHETLVTRVPTEFWRIPYAIGGVILLLISAAVWWFGFRQFQMFVLMFTGIAVMSISGIAVEEFVMRGFVWANPSADWLYVFEEIFEMVGATIVLATFLSYAQDHLDTRRWARAGRFVTGMGLFWALWFLVFLFFVPAIEARFFATPVDVEYDNGLLTLVAYRMNPKITDAGGEVELTMYWRANRPLPEDYSVSVHALTHPEVASVAQSDDLNVGPIPSRAWFPNVTMRRTIYVQLPKGIDTPADLWLMVRVWWGPWPFLRPWQDTTGLAVTRSDVRQQLAFDAVIIDSVAVRPQQASPEPQFATDYTFPGFALKGIELPQAVVTGDSLPLKFWWQADKAGTTSLTQFVHFVAEDGEQVYGFDQEPFGGSFPTSVWPAGMQALDEWNVPLPADLPAGEYSLYSGMYDLNTMQRSPVTDDAGAAVADNRVFLGTVTIDPALAPAEPERVDISAFCYATGDATPIHNTLEDTLVRMNRFTGETEYIGFTTSFSAEALTFNPDSSRLYTVDDREEEGYGQFGWIDPLTGLFTAVGAGLSTPDNMAKNTVFGEDILEDVDGISIDPATDRLWAAIQDAKNYLFQIDPETGEVVRNTFGPGNDYIKIDLSNLTGAPYVDVEDVAIDPNDGTFYVIASSDAYDSLLTRIDFDTINPETGTVQVVEIGQFVSTRDNTVLRDVEGLSFHNDGTLYASTTDHTVAEADQESLWQVDPATARVTHIGKFNDTLDAVDFEGIACGSGISQ